jgi:hypothetical protein
MTPPPAAPARHGRATAVPCSIVRRKPTTRVALEPNKTHRSGTGVTSSHNGHSYGSAAATEAQPTVTRYILIRNDLLGGPRDTEKSSSPPVIALRLASDGQSANTLRNNRRSRPASQLRAPALRPGCDRPPDGVASYQIDHYADGRGFHYVEPVAANSVRP